MIWLISGLGLLWSWSYDCWIYNCLHMCEFESCSWRGVLNTTLCDKVCQWLVTCRWFSQDTPVSFNNKTDHHDITQTLLKVALNTITLTLFLAWNHLMFVQFSSQGKFSITSKHIDCFRYLILKEKKYLNLKNV